MKRQKNEGRYLAVHEVNLTTHRVGPVLVDTEGVAGVIYGPGNPVPNECGTSIVSICFPKDGIQQDVATLEIAPLHKSHALQCSGLYLVHWHPAPLHL